MSQDLVGLIFMACIAACFAAVMVLMADIARPTPQGGSTAVVVSYASRPATCVPARSVVVRQVRGRHRK